MSNSENNKRIAKNTLMLYIRMLLSVIVSLYTSRVVLEVLGVEDYGIYGLVGGVVAMFSFLNASMAGATSRFLTFEMGRGDKQRLQDTFSSAMIIHMGIALVVLILAETVGLWFLCNKLVIPEGRMEAAHWVYQFSILGLIASFTQVPYNATIIAHENMDVYAYVELAHVFLKLAIVYLLTTIGDWDKLVFYAFLVLMVNILVVIIYRVYCVKKFEEAKLSFKWDKNIVKSMFGFSAWEVLGHFGFTFRTQGVNVVLNMFFGVAINAVTHIATTVQNTLLAFSNNVLVAIKPQIIKRYALGHLEEMVNLIMSGIRFNLLLQLMITLPLIFCMEWILNIWLRNPPDGCVRFSQIMLCSNIISSVSQIIYSGIQSTGNLRITSICRNFLYVGTPFLLYLLFLWNDLYPVVAYVLILCSQVILLLVDVLVFRKMIPCFNLKGLFILMLKVLVIVLIISLVNGILLNLNFHPIIELLIVTLNTVLILTVLFYSLIFESVERGTIKRVVHNIYKRVC